MIRQFHSTASSRLELSTSAVALTFGQACILYLLEEYCVVICCNIYKIKGFKSARLFLFRVKIINCNQLNATHRD